MDGQRGMAQQASFVQQNGVALALLAVATLGVVVATWLPLRRSAAQRAVCVGNLQAMHRALLAYAADYDGGAPPAAALTVAKQEVPPPRALRPYLPNKNLLRCPADRAREDSPNTSYTYNPIVGYFPLGGPWEFRVPEQQPDGRTVIDVLRVSKPETMPVLWDNLPRHAGFRGWLPGAPVGVRNVLYADGHVADLTLEDPLGQVTLRAGGQPAQTAGDH